MKAHEAIYNSGLVCSTDREKPHQPIAFSFVVRIYSECNAQIFISGEMSFPVALAALQ